MATELQTVREQPELDEVLYRLDVLRLQAGDDEGDDGNVDDSNLPSPGLADYTSGTITLPQRSSSITTCPSLNRRSTSPSATSQSTTATSRSSHENTHHARAIPKSLPRLEPSPKSPSTNDYVRFLAQAEQQKRAPPVSTSPTTNEKPPLSPSTVPKRRPFGMIRRLTQFSRAKKNKALADDVGYCTRCGRATKKSDNAHVLGCGHWYCAICLHQLITTVMRTAQTIPVTCCRKPVSPLALKRLLNLVERERFLKMVVELDAARLAEASCPQCHKSFSVGDADSSENSVVMCRGCNLKSCRRCASRAHHEGQACPADWTLEVLLELGPDRRWVQCNHCGRLHDAGDRAQLNCHCRTKICGTCGSRVDEAQVACRACNASSHAEEDPPATLTKEVVDHVEVKCVDMVHILERLEAEARSLADPRLQELRRRQTDQQGRFLDFEQKQKWVMWTRHGQKKVEILDGHADLEQSMRKRHLETVNILEDRHVAAEMELRQTLAQEERACLIRLRHMEDYCQTAVAKLDPAAAHKGKLAQPKAEPHESRHRVITDRDRRELEQQYILRDNMGRLHEARINVLRDQQARQLEGLEKRQRHELEQLVARRLEAEMEALEASFAQDEAAFDQVFRRRQDLLQQHWLKEDTRQRKILEKKTGSWYAPLHPIAWPDDPRHHHHQPPRVQPMRTNTSTATAPATPRKHMYHQSESVVYQGRHQYVAFMSSATTAVSIPLTSTTTATTTLTPFTNVPQHSIMATAVDPVLIPHAEKKVVATDKTSLRSLRRTFTAPVLNRVPKRTSSKCA